MPGDGKGKTPPDGGWGWMVVMGVSLINLSTRPVEPSFGLLFGDLLQDLSIATTGAGIIVSCYEAVINFSGLFVGPLIKSYSFRKVAMVGSVLTGFGLVATYPAASMTHILITYSIINGLGIGFSSSASFVALNHYFKKRRGQAVGLTMAGTGLGLMLMPQAVRYLTEEYNFSGAMLVLGAFALNACVGSSLLQPVKWHLLPSKPDAEKMIGTIEDSKPAPPQITITNTIEEEEAEEEAEGETTPLSGSGVLSGGERTESRGEGRKISERFYLKLDRKYSLIDRDYQKRQEGGLNKSSTEPKFERYFEEAQCRKISEVRGGEGCISRRRKGSTISNLSNLDFHGSFLHLHAIEHEVNDNEVDGIVLNKAKHPDNNNEGSVTQEKQSVWRRFAVFMDLDLLKDPIYLNLLFGISIFYIGEFNFKMVVPFFLAELGHTKSETAFCLSMMAAADIVARLVLPPLCDKLEEKKLVTRRTMFMTAAVFLAISRSALAETGEWIQLEVILIISGFFRGATLINYMLVISEYCEGRMDKLPAAFGIQMVGRGIFIVTLGPLIGVIRDETNSYPICIHSQSVCMFLCVLAWSVEYLATYRRGKKKEAMALS